MNIFIYGGNTFRNEIHKILDHGNIRFKIEDGEVIDIVPLRTLIEKIEEDPSQIFIIDQNKIIEDDFIKKYLKFLVPKDGIEKSFLDEFGIGDISIPEYTEQNQYQQQQQQPKPKPKPILKREKKSSSNIKKPNTKFSIQYLDDFNLDYSSKEREKLNGDGGGGGSFKNDLGNTDNAPKGWDDDFEKICANLIDESQINTFLHQKSNRYYTKWSRRFQIPIIIMSANAGSGNFMSSSFGQYERLAIIIIGVISIFTSILS